MTDNEREDVLRVHETRHRNWLLNPSSGNQGYQASKELPDRGRGMAIAYAFKHVYLYFVHERSVSMIEAYPSYSMSSFLHHGLRVISKEEVRSLLLSLDFSKDCGVLRDNRRKQYIIDDVLSSAIGGSWDDFCTLLAMINIRDPILKNEQVDKYAPYQVAASRNSVNPNIWYNVKVYLSSLAQPQEIGMDKIEEVMKRYLRE